MEYLMRQDNTIFNETTQNTISNETIQYLMRQDNTIFNETRQYSI